jgi:DNA-binding transcriptional regulator YbjK
LIEAVLEASARVLVREGLSGFNTNRVAEIAGVSVGLTCSPEKSSL